MCDYSLHSIKSRPAKVGDKLTTRTLAQAREDLLRQKIRTWWSAFDQEPNCRLPARSCTNRLVSLVGEIR